MSKLLITPQAYIHLHLRGILGVLRIFLKGGMCPCMSPCVRHMFLHFGLGAAKPTWALKGMGTSPGSPCVSLVGVKIQTVPSLLAITWHNEARNRFLVCFFFPWNSFKYSGIEGTSPGEMEPYRDIRSVLNTLLFCIVCTCAVDSCYSQ